MIIIPLEVLWRADIILRPDKKRKGKDEGEGRDFFEELDAFFTEKLISLYSIPGLVLILSY